MVSRTMSNTRKKLPFKAKYIKGPDGKVGFTITDPYQVYEAFDYAATLPDADCHTIIIDTATYLMDMFESVHVIGSTNTMQGWSEYAQYWKRLLQHYVATSTKNVIILAHTSDVTSGEGIEILNETLVKVKGSLMNQGIESYFSCVVSTKKMPIAKLKETNPMLNITPLEEAKGFKYVFQTDLTKDTVNERIRSPMGMWEPSEIYIDNNAQHILDKLNWFYND